MQSRIRRTLLLGALVALALALSACGDGGSEGPCGPANCGGCCLIGQCVMPSGQNGSACGTQGAMCSPCAAGTTCNWLLGGCGTGDVVIDEDPRNTPCGSTCAGCCDPATNKCVDVTVQNNQNCGNSNQDCRACASAESCTSGRCGRNRGESPDQCDASIECFSQTTQNCELGLTRQNCGIGGSCLQCGKNEWCSNGNCEAATTAVSGCLNGCAGKGCCNADGRCIKFAASSSSDGFWGDLLTGSGSLSNTQNDANCGTEKCLKCPAGYECDTQVGECVDSRYMRDFRICISRILVKDVPADGKYASESGWWGDLTNNLFTGDLFSDGKKPDIRVTVKVGSQSGSTSDREGVSGRDVDLTRVGQEHVAQECSGMSQILAAESRTECVKDTQKEWLLTYPGGKTEKGYLVVYGNDCPLRVSEDELRGSTIEFVVEEVDLWGSRIGTCSGEVVGWRSLQGTCDRTGMSECAADCRDLATKERQDDCLMDCYYVYDACRLKDGLVGNLLIESDCDQNNIYHLEARASLIRSTVGF